MNTRKIFNGLYSFLLAMRRSGTTTLIKEISSKHDVYVLVSSERDKELFGECAISFSEFSRSAGLPLKPVLVDNSTLLRLCESAANEIDKLDDGLNAQRELVKSIKDLIIRFENVNCIHDNSRQI